MFYGSHQQPPCNDPLEGVLCIRIVNQVLENFVGNLLFAVLDLVWAIHASTSERSPVLASAAPTNICNSIP